MSEQAPLLRVGFFSHGAWPWQRQTPDNDGRFGRCQFIFDGKGPFDYVVVYDGLSEKLSLDIPKARTLFVCSEPMNVKRYLPGFVGQFGRLVSADPGLPHPDKVSIQAGLPWHYGIKTASPEAHAQALTYQQIEQAEIKKTKVLSVICSNKNFTPEHRRRLAFVEALKELMGDQLDVFGRGFREIDDKAEVLAPYKYHVALENCDFRDYWTEKISDPFLGMAFPFYGGCINLQDYYPADSFIRVDLDDPARSARIIADAIAADTYGQRQAALRQARDLTLQKHNLFSMLEQQILAMEARSPIRAGRWTLQREQYFLPKPAAARASLVDVVRRYPPLFNLLKKIYYASKTQKELLPGRMQIVRQEVEHWWQYLTNKFHRTHQHWLWARGEDVLRFNYTLTPASVVFDVGGYEGNWAAEINRRFGSRVYVFEPVAAFAQALQQRFKGNSAITTLPYGLSNRNDSAEVSLLSDASSLFQNGAEKETVSLRDIAEVLNELQAGAIDLMKINIEGGEFPLLDRLIETGDITRVKDIQVQFHPFVEDAEERYERLARLLGKTHQLTWRYPYVWENWRRKEVA